MKDKKGKIMEAHDRKILFSHKSDLHSTPQWLFDKLNAVYGFTLDPASSDDNFKCLKHYTEKENGLTQSWANEIVFVNPPYSENAKWLEKSYNEAKNNMACVIVLIPARTDTRYFHDYIIKANSLTFIKGRLKFGNAKNAAPFPSMIVEFNPYYVVKPIIHTMENK